MSKSRAIKVVLFTRDGQKEYFFGSMKAIYTKLSEEQIGVRLATLYSAGITAEKCYANSKCVIRYVEINRLSREGGI